MGACMHGITPDKREQWMLLATFSALLTRLPQHLRFKTFGDRVEAAFSGRASLELLLERTII